MRILFYRHFSSTRLESGASGVLRSSIQSIADNSAHEASYKAKALLFLVHGTTYDHPRPYPNNNRLHQIPNENNSVELIESNINLTAYPNPANNEISLALSGEDIVNAYVDFQSIVGQKVKSVLLTPKQVKTVSLNGISSGVYILHLYVNNEYIGQRKIIISK